MPAHCTISRIDPSFERRSGECFVSLLVRLRHFFVRCLWPAMLLPALLIQALPAAAGPDDWAVIIGNKTYGFNVPAVAYAHRDAIAVKRAMKALYAIPDKNITMLKDAKLSTMFKYFGRTNVGEGLLFNRIKNPSGRLFVYFSGHGVPYKRKGVDQAVPVLLPADGDPSAPGLTGMQLPDLLDMLKSLKQQRLPSGQVYLILEACFSGVSDGGHLIESVSSGGVGVELNLGGAGTRKASDEVIVMAAAQHTELANWDHQAKLGVFTDSLLQGLFGEARHGAGAGGVQQVNLSSLREFVRARVSERLLRLYPDGGRSQSPSFSGSDKSVIVAMPGQFPLRESRLLANEQARCESLNAAGSAAEIRKFIAGCVYCSCREKLRSRIRMLQHEKRNCEMADRHLRQSRKTGNLKLMKWLAKNISCPHLQANVDSALIQLSANCQSDRKEFTEIRARANIKELSNFLKRVICDEVRTEARAVVNRMRGACDRDRPALEAAERAGDVTRLRQLARTSDCPQISSSARRLSSRLQDACKTEGWKLIQLKKRQDARLLTSFISESSCAAVRDQARAILKLLEASCDSEKAGLATALASNNPGQIRTFISTSRCSRHRRVAIAKALEVERSLRPKITVHVPYKECDSCPSIIPLRPGCYLMGSSSRTDPWHYENEGPVQQVKLVKPFAIGQFEVTMGEWLSCVQDNACTSPRISVSDRKSPVRGITWQQAQAYVAWLSRKTNAPYRLPSEAEWEYAARAGTTSPYSTGGSISSQQAAFRGRKTRLNEPRSVGSYRANNWRLHEMHGNVAELVADCYRSRYTGHSGTSAPRAKCRGTDRVARGGSWREIRYRIRSAYRVSIGANEARDDVGLRVARDVPELTALADPSASCRNVRRGR